MAEVEGGARPADALGLAVKPPGRRGGAELAAGERGRRQDYGLWLRLLRQVAYAHSLPEVLADYRVAPASLSGGKLGAAAATWRLYREAEGLGRPRAAFYLGHNLVLIYSVSETELTLVRLGSHSDLFG